MPSKRIPHPYPEPTRTEILWLCKQVSFLINLSLVLRHMYSEKAQKLYNPISGFTLQVIPWVINDTITSGIGKLTDPAGSGDRKNISLQTLAATLLSLDTKYSPLAVRIEKLISRKDIQNIRRHRHKRVAHSDYGVHLEKGKLPRFKNNVIEKILRDISRMLDSIAKKVLGGELMHSHEEQIQAEAELFLSILKKGIRA